MRSFFKLLFPNLFGRLKFVVTSPLDYQVYRWKNFYRRLIWARKREDLGCRGFLRKANLVSTPSESSEYLLILVDTTIYLMVLQMKNGLKCLFTSLQLSLFHGLWHQQRQTCLKIYRQWDNISYRHRIFLQQIKQRFLDYFLTQKDEFHLWFWNGIFTRRRWL